MKNDMTAAEFIAHAEKYKLQLHAIVKEVPPKSGRKLLLGFEFGKRSRKYKEKFMLRHPINLDDLKNGPIRKPTATPDEPADAGVATPATPALAPNPADPNPPAVCSDQRTALGDDPPDATRDARGNSFASRLRSSMGAFFSACARAGRKTGPDRETSDLRLYDTRTDRVAEKTDSPLSPGNE